MMQEEQYDNKLMLYNERVMNKFVTFSMTFFGVIQLFITLFFFFGPKKHHIGMGGFLIPFVGLICIIPAIVSAKNNFYTPRLKFFLFLFLILASTISDFIFSYYALLVMGLPLMLSIRYYNWKFTAGIAIVTLSAYFVSSVCCFYMLQLSETYYHYYTCHLYIPCWSHLENHLVSNFIIKFVLFLLPSYIAIKLAYGGKFLIVRTIKTIKSKASVETQLQLAGKIQDHAIPKEKISTDELELCATITPAKETAGDFYDYSYIDEDTIFVVIGDVSDKGLAAAMVMMSIKNSLHAYIAATKDLEKSVQFVNNYICEKNELCMFVTLWCAFINVKSGHMKFINAGHSFPYVKHANGEIIMLKNDPVPFIGAIANVDYKVHEYILKENDLLLLYTDGVTDAENEAEERFSENGIEDTLLTSNQSACDLCVNLTANINAFIGSKSLFDDTTMIAIQKKSPQRFMKLPAVIDSVTAIIDWISSYCKAYEIDDNTTKMISTALDEILANIVDYAYNDYECDDRSIVVEINPSEEKIEMTISDFGIPFDPLAVDMPDLEDTERIGGLGIFLIKNIMDDVTYKRVDNKNVLWIQKMWRNDSV